MLLGTGVMSALERGALDAVSAPLESPARLAGVTLLGPAAGRFAKKPAMLCCFGPDFADCELPVFFKVARGVAISLPSMPRAMVDFYYTVQCKVKERCGVEVGRRDLEVTRSR